MRFKTRFMLTVGCVCLLAMSAPALGDPLPKPRPNGAQQKPAQQPKHAAQQRSAVHRARDERASRQVSMPVTSDAQRSAFGWPALVSEARKYMGTNPTDRTRLWCATFMNMVLAKAGYSGTNSDAAKSFAQYGRRISEPRVGAIAVLTRGKKGGHVGVVSGVDANGNPIIISGNHNKRVGESVYPRSRVIAYVMPSENRAGNTRVADRGAAGKPAADSSLDSPIAELIAAIETENRPANPRQDVARQNRPQPAAQQLQSSVPAEPATARRALPLDPALAELFGVKQRDQAEQRIAPQPQREMRIEQVQSGRVAADTGLAGRLGLPLSR